MLYEVITGVLPRATIEITMSNYNAGDLYVSEVVEKGRSEATFAGDPQIVITKYVDKSKIELGEEVTVTVKARNTGNDTANNVLFTDPKQEHVITSYSIHYTKLYDK